MAGTRRIVVVGGGITGTFAAYFLARDGFDVTLVERAGIGNQASGHNPGGINPMHGTGIPGAMQAFAWESFQLNLAHWDAIGELSGIAFSPKRPPRIHVALDEADIAGLERLHALHSAAEGFSARWLERADLLALDARLNPSAVRSLWTEGNAKVDAHAYTRAVAAAAEKLGAKIEPGNVVAVNGAGGRAHGVVVDSQTLPCDGAILATGPWVSEVAQWIGCTIPLEPVKGELLLVRTAGPPLRHAFAWRAAAAYGNGNTEVWLGGNEERAGFDCTPTQAARELILERVRHLMPGLQIAGVTSQIAALRAMTADDFPVIGLAPGWANIALALGGGRKGMLYGAAMGLAAAELVTRGETLLPIAACTPARVLKS
jgi:glycine oxidase